MKKNLLLALGLMASFAVSAQVEVGFITEDKSIELGIENKPTLAAGTVLAATDNVEMVTTIEDAVSAQNAAFNGFKKIVVNGQEIAISNYGIGGTANGKGDLVTPPSGWSFQFNVKADGYLIVVSKISSNKNFLAFEGAFNGSPAAISYTLGMDIKSDVFPEVSQAIYTLPADKDGYVDMAAADIEKYTFGGNTVAWPIRIATENPEAESAGNGTGVMIFPVWADAESYVVLATGSKMNSCGYVFVPGDTMPAVSLVCEADENYEAKTITVTGEAGIANIIADENLDVNAPMYNVLGQRVNESYKGLVIKNGKKFINK